MKGEGEGFGKGGGGGGRKEALEKRGEKRFQREGGGRDEERRGRGGEGRGGDKKNKQDYMLGHSSLLM